MQLCKVVVRSKRFLRRFPFFLKFIIKLIKTHDTLNKEKYFFGISCFYSLFSMFMRKSVKNYIKQYSIVE